MMEDKVILKEIEGKGFGKTIWSPAGRAMHTYNMVEDGDRIAVGVSGGKDSLTTLNVLLRVQKISNINFEIIPIHIHPNTDTASYEIIEDYCKKNGLNLIVEHTNLSEMLFGEKEVKNPCFLCGRIRRGILYRIMKEREINKLALGHHKDDIIETFMMNVLYQGNMKMMKPSYISEEYGVRVIRPLAFVEENDIIKYVKKMELPVVKSDCPYETSENSKRLRVKNLIKDLAQENNNVRSVIFNSIRELLD